MITNSITIRKLVKYKMRHKHGIRFPQRIAELIVPVVVEVIAEGILRSERVTLGRIGYFHGAKTPSGRANLHFNKRNTFVFQKKFLEKLKAERLKTDTEQEFLDEHEKA